MSKTKEFSTLAELFDYASRKYSSHRVSCFVDEFKSGKGMTYEYFRNKCIELSTTMSRYGIGAGERVAIISESNPNWTTAMFSAVTFGRVMVPVLPDCSPNEVNNILVHSGAKVAFVSKNQLGKISQENLNQMSLVISIEDFSLIREKTEDFTCDGKVANPSADDLAAILYTSGTSGAAKGVMLSHRNICHNVNAVPSIFTAKTKDVWLSILPMAHTYELSLGVFLPFSVGATVVYLRQAPSPAVLLPAMKEVRPTVIPSVPLIIEKIYRKSILKTIRKSPMLSWMEKHTRSLMYALVGSKLKKTFGGRIRIFAVGGAKLDSEVEAFLAKAHFPYAIGYGMTECAPLIAAAAVGKTMIGSTGVAVNGVDVRILDPDPQTGMGEIVVKGPNVMLGYYKDPDRTREAFTADGYLHTKDLAFMDEKGRFSIRGRLGNMILGASGENIYPEEIETVINGIDQVEESIVKSENGKLVALVKLNDNVLNWDFDGEEAFLKKVEGLQNSIRNSVNSAVSKASQLSAIRFVREPFEKTATKKIRRFKYTN